MRVLITGSDGQLGTDLCKELTGFELIPCTQNDIEITDVRSVKAVFARYRPEAVINTAAFVRVDDCEAQVDTAFSVNALGARNIAVASQEIGAKLLQISTDYVFGGSASANSVIASEASLSSYYHAGGLRGEAEASQRGAKSYTEFDSPSPINVYGQSKFAGEDFVRHLCHRFFIVRTSGLFGIAGSLGKGGNFVETMIRMGKERPELRVVNDQIFSPTYTTDLARKIAHLISTEYYGTFHITNSGICSWYEFASEIIRLTGLSAKVIPITSDQFPQKARRPAYSVLDHFQLRLLGMDDIRTWQEALRDYLNKKRYIQ
jgi:dTDP-4-dehydrorhamnose reductase